MRKIIFLWPINKETSLWVYIRNLKNNLEKYGFQFENRERIITKLPLWKIILKGIFDIFNTTFPGKYTKDDIIIIPHSSHLFPPLLLLTKAKKIHIVHDFFYYDKDFFENLGWFHRKILYPFYYLKIHKLLYKLAFKKADKIVAISQATKNEIIEKFGEHFRWKIEVIYNGINHDIFQNRKIFEKISPIQDKKYLLYIGSELDRKNLKNIILWFGIFVKKYPDYSLVKAPNEWNLYRKNTLKYIKESGLKIDDNFFFIDKYLSHKDIASLYQYSQLFLFPSLKEGFGFPIIEAIACWIPVITSNYEPMLELVPYKDMLINPQKPQEIAKMIEKILFEKWLREKLSKQWIEFVKKFSWEENAKQFVNLFEKIKK